VYTVKPTDRYVSTDWSYAETLCLDITVQLKCEANQHKNKLKIITTVPVTARKPV